MSLLKLNALKNLCAKVTGISVEDNDATTIAEAIDKIANNYSGASEDTVKQLIAESQAISTKEYPLDRDAPEFGGDEVNINIKRRGVFGYLSGRFDADYFNNGKLYESCFKQYMQKNGRKCRYICKLGNVQEFEMVDEQLVSFSYSTIGFSNSEIKSKLSTLISSTL